MQKMLILVVVVFLAGCEENKPVVPPIPLHDMQQSGPTVDSYLSYQTTYTLKLTQERVLKVTAEAQPWLERSPEGVRFTDELEQSDGKRILFDCNNIAERIIDANLVREITPYCASLHKQALDYWKQINYEPDEFEDREGTRWRKVGK